MNLVTVSGNVRVTNDYGVPLLVKMDESHRPIRVEIVNIDRLPAPVVHVPAATPIVNVQSPVHAPVHVPVHAPVSSPVSDSDRVFKKKYMSEVMEYESDEILASGGVSFNPERVDAIFIRRKFGETTYSYGILMGGREITIKSNKSPQEFISQYWK